MIQNCTFALNIFLLKFIQFSYLRIKIITYILFGCFLSCIDPISPVFDFKSDIIIINALASTSPGSTSVSVEKTRIQFGEYITEFISDCKITLINSLTKERINFKEEEGIYIISKEFKVSVATQWEIEIILPNGSIYRSTSEIVPIEVPISKIYQNFNPEMTYDEGYGGYLSGHEIRIDFQDPPDQNNFFLYRYKAFEKELYCKLCEYGVLRDGKCLSQINNPFLTKEYYTYLCDTPCWKITYNNEIIVFDDKFVNGKLVSNLLVGKLPYVSKQDIYVELIKLNVSEDSYKYFKTIKDLVDNNSGLNSPLPTALIGNFSSISNPEETVLGRFTVASSVTKPIFIPRDNISERLIGDLTELQPEIFGDPIPNPLTYVYSCDESRFRTSFLNSNITSYFDIADTFNNDFDGDGILNSVDNCISSVNPNQNDLDFDGIGDLCDNDADGDGYIIFYEKSCFSSDLDQESVPEDNDLDFIPDCIDLDDDNDEYIDEHEEYAESDPFDANSLPLDSDNDYLPDVWETRVSRTNPYNPDTDGDGYIDGKECCPRNPNRN